MPSYRRWPRFAPHDPGIADSVWSASAGAPVEAPPFAGEAQCDVVIVGGGFTGCSAALHLAEKGVSVILLEAEDIGFGASGRNSGMLNPGSFVLPDDLMRRLGPDYGPRYIEDLGKAPDLVREICERHGIDAHDDGKGIIRAAHDTSAIGQLQAYVEQWGRHGARVEALDRTALVEATGTETYVSGLVDHRSSCVQPLAYARGLARAAMAKGARLHSFSAATELARTPKGHRISVNGGHVDAEAVIITTNAYSGDLIPSIKASVIPVGAFGFATDPLDAETRQKILTSGNGLYDTRKALTFLRYDRDGRFIIGSIGYLPWQSGEAGESWPNRAFQRLFPSVPVPRWRFRWSGSMAFTPDYMPRLSDPMPGVFALVGLNGRGIGPGTYFGRLLARRVLGEAVDLPVPVSEVNPVPFRNLRMDGFDLAFRMARNGLLP